MSENEESTDEVAFTGEIVSMSTRFWGGWGFGRIKTDSNDEYKIVGALEGFGVGSRVSIRGVWKENEKYGAQINVLYIMADTPKGRDGIMAWLEDRLPQIGPVRSKALIDRFGDSLWEVLQTNATELVAIDGITQQRAEEIAAAFSKFKDERAQFSKYYALGLNRKEAKDLVDAELCADEFSDDPFVCYLCFPRLSFRRLDKIREITGGSKCSQYRKEAAVVEAVKAAKSDGHTVMYTNEAIEFASAFAGYRASDLVAVLHELVARGFLIVFEGRLMLPEMSAAEQRVAEVLLELVNGENTDSGSESRQSG